MAIGEAELNRIGEYVQSHLSEWMDKLGVRPVPDPVTNTQLLERVDTVDNRVVHLDGRLGRVEERVVHLDGRLGRVEERVVRVEEELKAQREVMTVRFGAIDDRFQTITQSMNERFEAVNNRFDSVDDRFETFTQSMNDRFDSVNQNINVLKWFVVTSFVVLGAAISLLAVLS